MPRSATRQLLAARSSLPLALLLLLTPVIGLAQEPDPAPEDAEIEAIIAELEAPAALLSEPEPAAAGSPLAGISVFGWLANRFGYDTPDLTPVASATSAAGNVATTAPGAVAAAAGNPLSLVVRSQLLVTRDEQLWRAAREYEAILQTLESQVLERVSGGAAMGVEANEIAAWRKDAEIEVSRASSRSIMSIDAHEDNFGYRIGAREGFPDDWDSRQEATLESMRDFVQEAQIPAARRQWRLVAMEAETLALFQERLVLLDSIRRQYQQQYDIGQRLVGDIIGLARNYFDIEVQKIDTEYRLYDAQAKLLGIMGRLFNGDLQQAAETADDTQ